MGTLSESEVIDLYLRHWRERSPETQEASFQLDMLLDGDVNIALRVVLALVEKTPPDLIDVIAAGPVEDLIARRGPLVIDRLLDKAETNPRLRRALYGVWIRADMDSNVSQRLVAALEKWNEYPSN